MSKALGLWNPNELPLLAMSVNTLPLKPLLKLVMPFSTGLVGIAAAATSAQPKFLRAYCLPSFGASGIILGFPTKSLYCPVLPTVLIALSFAFWLSAFCKSVCALRVPVMSPQTAGVVPPPPLTSTHAASLRAYCLPSIGASGTALSKLPA